MIKANRRDFPQVELPVIPKNVFNIVDFGAVSGGKIKNTDAINNAVKHANYTGGGRVVIPAGMWLTGPITLLSNVELHLESGSFVIFTHCEEDYPLIKTSYEGGARIRAVSPINACDQDNIAITGDGVIDGNGQLWRPVKRMKMTEGAWANLVASGGVTDERIGMWFPSQSSYDGHMNHDIKTTDEDALEKAKKYFDFYRPVMVSLVRCRKVLLEGVTFQNSPAWNVHPLFCEHITIKNVSIRNPWNAQNGDGLDLESCKYADIVGTRFDVGDDAICMKAGKNAEGRSVPIPTEYVSIRDCVVYHGHGGFVVGSEMSRGVRKIHVSNCTFVGTDVGIRFKSALGRGGVVEDIFLENINMVDIPEEAILFTMGYNPEKNKAALDSFTAEDVPEFKNVYIKDVVCRGAGRALNVFGLDQLPIHDITIENASITAKKGVKLVKAANIELKNVSITCQEDPEQFAVFTDDKLDGPFETDF